MRYERNEPCKLRASGWFWRVLSFVVFILAAIGTVNLGIWVADREPPIRYEEADALAEEVPQGKTIDIAYTVFRSRVCPVVTRRWLTDSRDVRHSIPTFTVGIQRLAGRESYVRTITIPPTAAVGEAGYQVILEYVCNPLQNVIGPITVYSPIVRFRIVRGEGEPFLATPQNDQRDG